MSINSTVVHAQAGVRLVRTEQTAKKQTLVSFRLSTHRSVSPRFILDEAEAERAYEQEVEASQADPIVKGLMQRGVL